MEVSFKNVEKDFPNLTVEYIYHQEWHDGSQIFVTRVPDELHKSNDGGDYYQGYVLDNGELHFNRLLWSDFSDQGKEYYEGNWEIIK